MPTKTLLLLAMAFAAVLAAPQARQPPRRLDAQPPPPPFASVPSPPPPFADGPPHRIDNRPPSPFDNRPPPPFDDHHSPSDSFQDLIGGLFGVIMNALKQFFGRDPGQVFQDIAGFLGRLMDNGTDSRESTSPGYYGGYLGVSDGPQYYASQGYNGTGYPGFQDFQGFQGSSPRYYKRPSTEPTDYNNVAYAATGSVAAASWPGQGNGVGFLNMNQTQGKSAVVRPAMAVARSAVVAKPAAGVAAKAAAAARAGVAAKAAAAARAGVAAKAAAAARAGVAAKAAAAARAGVAAKPAAAARAGVVAKTAAFVKGAPPAKAVAG